MRGESVKASGSFLSPVDPVNQLASSFTAILRRNGASQLPSEYEDASGEKRQAIPVGQKGSDPPDTTGVELTFTILPAVPLEIRAVSAAEVEARQRQEEAAASAAAKQRADEEAAAKKRHEDEAAAAKKHQEDEAATKKLQAEEEARAEQRKRAQLRAQGLTRCRQADSKPGRVRCEKRVKKKYGAKKRPVLV